MLCLTSQDGCEVYCSDMKTHYKCDSNSKCLLNSTICDGKPDCLDGTDERNCEGIYLQVILMAFKAFETD